MEIHKLWNMLLEKAGSCPDARKLSQINDILMGVNLTPGVYRRRPLDQRQAVIQELWMI